MAINKRKRLRGATPIKPARPWLKPTLNRIQQLWRWYYLSLPLVVAIAISAVQYLPTYLNQWPIKQIEINGDLNYWDGEQLKQQVAWLATESFFSVELEKVQRELLALPLIEKVSLRKSWPTKISIFVSEAVPVAIWNKSNILTAEGAVMAMPTDYKYSDGLALISGPNELVATATRLFRSSQLNLQPNNVELKALKMTEVGSVELQLTNQWTVKLGQHEFQQRMVRLGHLLTAFNEQPINKIDLRYGKGAAIQWLTNEGVQNEPNA